MLLIWTNELEFGPQEINWCTFIFIDTYLTMLESGNSRLGSWSLSEHSQTGVPECRESWPVLWVSYVGCLSPTLLFDGLVRGHSENLLQVWNYSPSLEFASSVTNTASFNLPYWPWGCYVVILRENIATFSVPLAPW